MRRSTVYSVQFWAIAIGLLIVTCAVPCHVQSIPPLRGVYTPGFNAINSGVMPDPGLTYSNTFLDYSFNSAKCAACGELDPNVDVLVDVNVFMWVSKKKILGGNYGLVAGLPITNSSLSLAGENSFYQPVTMGWHLKRVDRMEKTQGNLQTMERTETVGPDSEEVVAVGAAVIAAGEVAGGVGNSFSNGPW